MRQGIHSIRWIERAYVDTWWESYLHLQWLWKEIFIQARPSEACMYNIAVIGVPEDILQNNPWYLVTSWFWNVRQGSIDTTYEWHLCVFRIAFIRSVVTVYWPVMWNLFFREKIGALFHQRFFCFISKQFSLFTFNYKWENALIKHCFIMCPYLHTRTIKGGGGNGHYI